MQARHCPSAPPRRADPRKALQGRMRARLADGVPRRPGRARLGRRYRTFKLVLLPPPPVAQQGLLVS